jgi:uncharacterized protein YbaR (Trm112 family)
MNLEEALKTVLACPQCGGALSFAASASERLATVSCENCGAAYPYADNILDFLSPPGDKTDP